MQVSNERNGTILCKWILVLFIVFSGITAQWNSMELFQTGEIAEQMKYLQIFSRLTTDGFLANLLFVVYGVEAADIIRNRKKPKNVAIELIGEWQPLTITTIVIGMLFGLMGCMKLTISNDVLGLFFLNNVGLTLSPNANSLLWFTASTVLASFAVAVLNMNIPEDKRWIVGLTGTIAGYVLLLQTGQGTIGGTYENIGVILNTGWLRAFCGIETGVLLTEFKDKCLTGIFKNTGKKPIIAFVILLGIFMLLQVFGRLPANTNEIVTIFLWAVFLEGILLLEGQKKPKRSLSRLADVILLFHPLVLGVYKTWIWTYRYNFVLRHPQLNMLMLCALILISGGIMLYLVVQPAERYIMSWIDEEQKKGECYDTI